jgi:hypothetical protein
LSHSTKPFVSFQSCFSPFETVISFIDEASMGRILVKQWDRAHTPHFVKTAESTFRNKEVPFPDQVTFSACHSYMTWVPMNLVTVYGAFSIMVMNDFGLSCQLLMCKLAVNKAPESE